MNIQPPQVERYKYTTVLQTMQTMQTMQITFLRTLGLTK